jgi:DNA-directed RNA polymerase specialized sigma subunit
MSDILKDIEDSHRYVVELREKMNDEAQKRNDLIARAVADGANQSDIARMLDVSRHRVSQLAAKGTA